MIKPFKLDDVVEALSNVGVGGITVLEVKGFGRQRGHIELYRGQEYAVNLLPKIMVVLFLDDDMVELAVEAIFGAARTGKIGDGKIAISELNGIVRVRTGETGVEAI